MCFFWFDILSAISGKLLVPFWKLDSAQTDKNHDRNKTEKKLVIAQISVCYSVLIAQPDIVTKTQQKKSETSYEFLLLTVISALSCNIFPFLLNIISVTLFIQ